MQTAGYASLSDPAGSSAILAAVSFLEDTLLGTFATTLAVIAIASIGFMMLSGRVNVRYGLTVILGCFVLFGASAIAHGIRASIAGEDVAAAPYVPPPAPPPPSEPPRPPANPDPYAGAAMPAR
jgi:type IV secretory pathway VirB2 component (pilin)